MKNRVFFFTKIILGIIFIVAGLNKLSNFIVPLPNDVVEIMTEIARIKWLLPLIAIVEIIGGTLLITNRYNALGAIIVFPITIGILLTHIIDSPSQIFLGLLIFAMNAWIIIDNKQKYLPIIKS